MKIKTERRGEVKESKYTVITIGLDRYRLTEIDGRLSINKTSDGDSDLMKIQPITGNQIEIY
jgi:hypothetical protein